MGSSTRIRFSVRVRATSDTALAGYGSRAPRLVASPAGALRSVGAYAHAAGPHWHYVGFGALGPRLSFRLAGQSADPPRWPARLLEVFAEHVSRAGASAGHYLVLDDPPDPDGRVSCGVLLPDPQLERVLQVVGLHRGELPRVSGDDYAGLVAALRRRSPLLVTEPARDALA